MRAINAVCRSLFYYHSTKGKTMNRKELIEQMARKSEITQAQAGEALNAFLNGVTSSLKKKQSVTLVGFGTFSVQARKARMGRNPATGETIKIKAQTVAKFSAGKKLKAAVNKK